MAQIQCGLQAITTATNCNLRGGIRAVYVAQYGDVDWATMLGDNTKWDTATNTIKGYTMVGAATFKKLTFERTSALLDVTYTRDADVFEILLTVIFNGKENARKLALENMLQCCSLVAHVFYNTGVERVLGVEFNGSTFAEQIQPLRVTRYLDSAGQLGQGVARDEIDLGGQSFYAPLFATVTEANMPV